MRLHEFGPTGATPILFLHGSGATGGLWRRHVEYFAGYRCLVPELPGFGDSAGEPWVSVEATARNLAAIIERTAPHRAHVVGISIGGVLTMQLLAHRPELIDHAVVDGAGVLPPRWLPLAGLGLRSLRPFLKTDWVTRTIARVLGFPEGTVEGLRQNFRRMDSASFVHAVTDALGFVEPAGLASAPCPTLFVAGARELKETLASNIILAAKMPHADARVAPGVHHGWIANDPLLHCRMVEAWIADRALPAELVPAEPA